MKKIETSEEELRTKHLSKRSRTVPLQKLTLQKLQEIYDKNKNTLQDEYRVKSFSDFVNYCIMKSLPTMEKQLKNSTIIYTSNFTNY